MTAIVVDRSGSTAQCGIAMADWDQCHNHDDGDDHDRADRDELMHARDMAKVVTHRGGGGHRMG